MFHVKLHYINNQTLDMRELSAIYDRYPPQHLTSELIAALFENSFSS